MTLGYYDHRSGRISCSCRGAKPTFRVSPPTSGHRPHRKASPRCVKPLTRAAALVTTAAVSALAPLAVPSADAATSTGCTGGGFTVSLPDGRTFRTTASAKIENANLSEATRLAVKGRYVEFDLAPV